MKRNVSIGLIVILCMGIVYAEISADKKSSTPSLSDEQTIETSRYPSGKYAGESLRWIKHNIEHFDWAKDWYEKNVEYHAKKLRTLSNSQIEKLISDRTPSITSESPNHPEYTPWYIWEYVFPDKLICKLDKAEYLYDPNDESEAWNVQAILRYYRLKYVCDHINKAALSYRIKGNAEDARVAAAALKRLAEVWEGYKIHHINTRKFYEEPNGLAGKITAWNTQYAMILSACADAYDLTCDSNYLSKEDKHNIKSKLFVTAIEFFRDPKGNLGFNDGRIYADEGFIYTCIAKMGLILGRSDVIDWVVKEVREAFNPANKAYRSDGWLDQGSIAYHIEGIAAFTELAEVLLNSGNINLYEDSYMKAFAKGLRIPVEIMCGNGVCPANNNSHWVG